MLALHAQTWLGGMACDVVACGRLACGPQALFASHALLGLSACGTNVALMISDLDE